MIKIIDNCNGWKFNLGEHVWWLLDYEFIEVIITKRDVDISNNVAFNKYLVKIISSNHAYWVKEDNLIKLVRE